MTDKDIWGAIEADEPRAWLVTVDGASAGKSLETAARIFDTVEAWLMQEHVDYFQYGDFSHRIEVLCPETEERMRTVRKLTVTRDSGVSTLQ